jgi:hypothetical protein
VDAAPVKVYGDATVLFPLLIAATFARSFKPKPPLHPLPRATSELTRTDSGYLS